MNLLRTLVELDRKATPGEWFVNGKQSIRGSRGEFIGKTNWSNGEGNAAFIAFCRTNTAAILDALALAEALQEKGQTSPTSAMGVCIASIRERAAQLLKDAEA